jgi:hypothetical protein
MAVFYEFIFHVSLHAKISVRGCKLIVRTTRRMKQANVRHEQTFIMVLADIFRCLVKR